MTGPPGGMGAGADSAAEHAPWRQVLIDAKELVLRRTVEDRPVATVLFGAVPAALLTVLGAVRARRALRWPARLSVLWRTVYFPVFLTTGTLYSATVAEVARGGQHDVRNWAIGSFVASVLTFGPFAPAPRLATTSLFWCATSVGAYVGHEWLHTAGKERWIRYRLQLRNAGYLEGYGFAGEPGAARRDSNVDSYGGDGDSSDDAGGGNNEKRT